ncbi:hypothetical protein [Thiohalocapsa sp. ML1]|jgi:hypothetical protein|uniref:hypothetical protein n=1 Tax=Thiohalocapsa sp. ML1 TaxID=1431688 RepID=UPI0012E36B6E|nr:hypothetical protein [Thiohalocapsa sp. ML1]
MPPFSRLFGSRKSSEELFTDAAATLARTLESVLREIGGEPSNRLLMRQETAAFALTYCTLIVLASSNGAPQDVERRSDEMNLAAVNAFMERGWVSSSNELINKLHERYTDYSDIIQNALLTNEHGGPELAFSVVFLNVYKPIPGYYAQLLMKRGLLMESLMQAANDVRKSCN